MTNIRKESRRNGFAVLLQLAAIICTAAAAYAQTNNAFSLSAEVGGKNATNLFLRLRLTNVGSNRLSIPLGYLPWNRSAISIVVMEDDPMGTPPYTKRSDR